MAGREDRMRRGGLWYWPGRKKLGYAGRLGLAQLALFLFIYGGADAIAEHHHHRVRLHFDFDLQWPFVPAMSIVYLSLNILLWSAVFVLRTHRELRAYAAALAVATVAAGTFFLLLPAQDAFASPTAEELGGWEMPYQVARRLALRHNFFPSLHVAFAVIAASALSSHARRWQTPLLWGWCAAIAASTLLIHEHYLVDVVSGVILGGIVERCIYRRWAQRRSFPAVAATDPSRSNRRGPTA